MFRKILELQSRLLKNGHRTRRGWRTNNNILFKIGVHSNDLLVLNEMERELFESRRVKVLSYVYDKGLLNVNWNTQQFKYKKKTKKLLQLQIHKQAYRTNTKMNKNE